MKPIACLLLIQQTMIDAWTSPEELRFGDIVKDLDKGGYCVEVAATGVTATIRVPKTEEKLTEAMGGRAEEDVAREIAETFVLNASSIQYIVPDGQRVR